MFLKLVKDISNNLRVFFNYLGLKNKNDKKPMGYLENDSK